MKTSLNEANHTRLPAEIISSINYIERERRQINPDNQPYEHAVFIAIAVTVGCSFFFALLAKITDEAFFTFFAVISLFAGLLYIAYQLRQQKKQSHHFDEYQDIYTRDVVLPMLNSLNQSFVYDKHGSILSRHGAILQSRFSLIARGSEDLVLGNVGSVAISFGEIEYTPNHADGGPYKALCFVADFNKNLQASTVISAVSNIVGLPGIKKSNLKKIQLDNPEFNKIYWTYSQDEIETRYILTATFMEKMLSIKNMLSGHFVFQDNKLLFLGNCYSEPRDNLKASLTAKQVDLFAIGADTDIYEQTHATYIAIKQLLDLVEIFDLNTRIWK